MSYYRHYGYTSSCGNNWNNGWNGRSNYCGCNNGPVEVVEEKKESSATAKTALGLAIGGLGLAAVNGGLFGGDGECGGGGLLGGLFGGRRGNCEQLARGRQAQTELSVIHSYMMPTWYELSELKKKVAVNEAVERKDQEINYLLFKRSEENTNAGFEINKLRTEAAFALADQRSQCCCDKNSMKIDYVADLSRQRTDGLFALARQEQQCCCDKTNAKIDSVAALERMRTEGAFALADQKQECCCNRLDERITCESDKINARIDCVTGALAYDIKTNDDRVNTKVDSAFVVNNLLTEKKIGEATKNMVAGEVYLSPASLADPYRAGTNVLLSRHYNSGCGSSGWGTGWNNGTSNFNNDCGCGCNGFNW